MVSPDLIKEVESLNQNANEIGNRIARPTKVKLIFAKGNSIEKSIFHLGRRIAIPNLIISATVNGLLFVRTFQKREYL